MKDSVIASQSSGVFLRTLWRIVVSAAGIFAWNSLKSGFIDVRRLARVPRLIALVGFALILIFIASILFNDPLRTGGVLEPLPLSSSAARGIFVPAFAVPLALGAVILAWSLILTSALHIQRWARWGVLIVFMLFGLPTDAFGGMVSAAGEDVWLLLAFVGGTMAFLGGLAASFIFFPRQRTGLTVEFTTVLLLVGGLFILFLAAATMATQLGSVNFVSGYLTTGAVTNPRNLTIPLIYLSGAELIDFGITFTSWGGQATARYAKRWMVLILLGAFLAYRWFGVMTEMILPGLTAAQWAALGGAALASVCLLPLAWWRARRGAYEAIPFKLVIGLILFMIAPQLLMFVGILVVSAFFFIQSSDPNVLQSMTIATSPMTALSGFLHDTVYLLLTGAGIGVAAYGLRRRRFSIAAYGMILAWTQFVYWFTENGRPLEALRYHYAELEFWILASLTALTVYWGARRQLNADRALKILALAVFTWLLHFTDFLDNPLTLLFGLAGISFTAFGILWSFLTAGGRWQVNGDSPQLPNQSRVLLAIGYVLLTLNVTHWFMVTHNLQERILSDDFTAAGLRIFGYTAAFLVIVEGGRALLQERA